MILLFLIIYLKHTNIPIYTSTQIYLTPLNPPAEGREIKYHHIEPIKEKRAPKTLKTERKPQQTKQEPAPAEIDTSGKAGLPITVNNKSAPDTNKIYTLSAEALLDTLLVRHPEYRQYILEQQVKNFNADKNNPLFVKMTLENRINNILHEYLKKNFPEGSEHAMNPNGGPGMQIPIDGLIDAIKKIFK